MKKKYFSVDEVNELIPRLEHHFRKLWTHKKEMSRAATRLRKLGYKPDLLEDEVPPQATREVEELYRQLREHYQAFKQNIHAIERTGGEIKDLELGRVEFPSYEADRESRLTWQLGVTVVAHREFAEEGLPSFLEYPKILRAG